MWRLAKSKLIESWHITANKAVTHMFCEPIDCWVILLGMHCPKSEISLKYRKLNEWKLCYPSFLDGKIILVIIEI